MFDTIHLIGFDIHIFFYSRQGKIMARIIVLDDLSQDGLKLLESAGNLEVVVKTGLKG